jgi:hypothetical protein
MDNASPTKPYLILAAICGLVSVVIVFASLAAIASLAGPAELGISTAALFGVTAMASVPAFMGIGIANCMSRARE